MDPVTALGVASAVVTFLEVGAQILKRLEELSKIGDVPIAFNDIRTRLPLLLSIVTSIQSNHEPLTSDAQDPFEKVVAGCYKHIEDVERILQKVTVAHGDTRWRKAVRAASSLAEESRIHRLAAALRDDIGLLSMLNVSPLEKSEKKGQRRPSASGLSVRTIPPSYSDAVGIFMVPFVRDERFIGRDTVIKEFDELFAQQGRISIAGVGGVGKSQVAIEYAYRFKEAHESSYVFWVYGGSVPRFYQGYKKIAQALDLPGWDDPDVSVLDLVSQWLETTTSSYLLILDNADNLLHYWPNKYKTAPTHDEPDVNLSSYLPGIQSGGKILITSRDSRVAGRLSRPYKPVLLQHMSIEEAVELFRSDLMKNEIEASDEEVAKVARALDCLPLAITQAASFIDENGISVAEYLKMLDSDDAEEYLQEELDDSRRDEDSINSVFRSWKLSFDQITKQKPRAAELLSLLGMFDRQSIPKWLLKVPEVITSAGVLQSFNLVFSPEGTSAFQLHRLCQRFVRIWLKRAGTLQRWQDAALNCVSQAYPTEIGFQERSTCETLAPHVATLLTYEYKSDTARLDLAHLLCWAADFDIERGLYQQALERAKQSLELFKDLVPSDDDRVASAMWLYGRLIYYGAKSQSDLLFAQELLQASLQTSSPSTLTFAESAFELAHLFYVLDKKKECLEMGRKSFECWQSIEGKSSVRTLDNWHDYSLQLAMFGYREEAIANWRDIIRLCPQSDASQNTKSIYTWRSLASIAEFQDDSSTAEILYAKLVELGSSIYGPEHVHVLDYRLSNAEQILRQNKPQRALEACRLALKSCVNKSEWRIAATCYEMMAECCLLENDTSREEELRLKCSDLHSKHLADNKESAEAIEATARCLLSNCKFEQANQLLQEVLSWREAKLGTNHPGTLEAIELAGICSSYLGRDDEAESAYKRAIDHSVNRNPRLVQNLCTALWNQSKWNELEHLCRDTLAQDDGEYAPELEQMLAAALEKQGKSSEAVVLKMKRLSEDSGHVAEGSRLLPKVPPRRSSIPPRFGRIIHPRTWSA